MRDHDHDTPSVEDLWRRIRVLERRRLDRVLVLVGLLGAFVVTAGAAALVPDTLAARSFRLVDAAGAARASLIATEAGAVSLSVYDASGAVAAELVLASTEPLLSVIDARGKRSTATATLPTTQAPPVPAAPPVERKSGPIGWGKPAEDGKEDDSFDWMN